MKIIAGALLLVVVAAVALFPYMQKEKACYDKTQLRINEINMNVPGRGWGKEAVCEARTDTLLQLEDCIRVSTPSGVIGRLATTISSNAIYIIRPLTKSLWTLKAEHNSDCSDFQTYQIQ